MTVALLVATLVGLFFPGLDQLPKTTLLIALSLMMLLACFKARPDDINAKNTAAVLPFYLVRFVVVPALVYPLAQRHWPGFGEGILLLCLAPAGISSPAITSMLGGSFVVSLGLVAISNALSPLVLPALVAGVLGRTVSMDALPMFESLATVVFGPILLHLPLRRSHRFAAFVVRHGNRASVFLLATMVALMVAACRQTLLYDHALLLEAAAPLLLCYAAFYGAPLLLYAKNRSPKYLSLALGSGINNTTLVMSVAFLYFPSRVGAFMVLCQVPWVAGVLLSQRFLKHEVSPNNASAI